MALLVLPVEVLQLIANAAITDRESRNGFQNLYLSCKTILNALQPLLPRYNLFRKWRDFGYRRGIRSVNGWPVRTPWQLLYEIHLQPQIVDIIEFADLRPSDYGEESEDANFDWQTNPDDGYERFDMRSAVSGILEHSSHLPEAGCNWSQWLDRMQEQEHQWRHENRFAVVEAPWGNVFLLSLLSHIETIVIDGDFFRADSPEDQPLALLLKHLVKNASHDSAPLSKLRQILPCADSGYDRRYGLSGYQYFLALPRLEAATLGCCIAMEDGYTGIALDMQVDDFPTVKELDLQDAVMGADEIYEQLSRMPSLEVFKLNEGVKWHGCGYTTFNPKAVVTNVARAVGHHLKGFSLTTASNLGGCESMIANFHEFEQLENLEFSCDLVEETGFRLVDTVPKTVRRLRIRGEDVFKGANAVEFTKKLFEGFEVGFPATLPNLEVVEAILPDQEPVREPEKAWEKFRDLIKPYGKVQALKQEGFPFTQYTKPWPDWFQPDSERAMQRLRWERMQREAE